MLVIEPEQRSAAKVAGFLYLLTNATAILGFSLRGPLVVSGDVVQSAKNIAASAGLYRLSLASDLLTVVCVLVLALSLYIVLRPINKNLAMLALLWRLGENFTLAMITLCGFAELALLSGAVYLQAFDEKQLAALAQVLYSVHGAGFSVGFVFLGFGSAVFSYLWLKSRYIPRTIAIWGIFSSLLLALVTLAILVFPALRGIGLTYMIPMGVYEIGLGIWLLAKGIRTPTPV